MEQYICQGCGAVIQTEHPNEPGYAPKSALEKEVILCKRCFRLKHYNEIQDVSLTDGDFLKMVSSIRDRDGLIVHLIDVFDVEGTLLSNLPRITGDNPIILIGNKLDLLPKSTNENKLKQWLRHEASQLGIKIKDVILISSVKGKGMDELKQKIELHRANKDVFIVGVTNVGKSTFINHLIQETTGEENAITTSYFPGTTLGFIEIPLDEESALVDTPGIMNKQQMAHYVSEKELKMITPKKEVKARVYQLNEQQTLFIGGLVRLDFIKGEKQSFICYFSNDLTIHRTKLENADALYEKHAGELLSPPYEDQVDQFPPLVAHSFKVEEGKVDIVFPGLGWISVQGDGATVAAHSPKGVAVTTRKSILSGH
ncbi:ribosome biogenesis GTPase YqeH [Oceanobacillus locisalsi]|uniref:Ribosome biogenesis GTPase YqeH n=1 Tax=Oceanobacillus locisalsi TaxID=546107 RepID=A0ABW3NGK3_9BACI